MLSPLASAPLDSAVEEGEIEMPTGVIPPVVAEQDVNEDENEEAPRRANPCSKLAALASHFFKRLARTSAAKNARQAPACVDLDYLPAVDTEEGYSIVVIKAVAVLDQQEAADAATSTPINTTTPPSDPTHQQTPPRARTLLPVAVVWLPWTRLRCALTTLLPPPALPPPLLPSSRARRSCCFCRGNAP